MRIYEYIHIYVRDKLKDGAESDALCVLVYNPVRDETPGMLFVARDDALRADVIVLHTFIGINCSPAGQSFMEFQRCRRNLAHATHPAHAWYDNVARNVIMRFPPPGILSIFTRGCAALSALSFVSFVWNTARERQREREIF